MALDRLNAAALAAAGAVAGVFVGVDGMMRLS